jgi:drug/metabolite transporter (DMT)-like permease
MPPERNLRHGAFYMAVSALLFAGMGALVKLVSASLPNEMVVFFRSAMGLVVLVPWLWHRGFEGIRTTALGQHLARSAAGLAAMYCFFYAIAQLPLAEATLLNYSTPLFIPFIAAWWLRERVPPGLWQILFMGLLGVVLILKPGLALFAPAALVGLASGILAAVAMTGIRRLSATEPVTRIVFYFTLFSTVVSAIPLAWRWQTPEPQLWGALIAIGTLATAAQLFLTRAYRSAPAAQVGPFTYLTVVFAAAAGWLFWDEVPDGLSLLGALLVVAGGVFTIRLAGRFAPASELPPPKSPG